MNPSFRALGLWPPCHYWVGLVAAALLPCGQAGEADAPERPTPMVQTQVEFIALNQERYTALIAGCQANGDDSALRRELAAMVAKGEAEIVETMACSGPHGQRSTTESVTEYIYPTQFIPPSLPMNAGSEDADAPSGPEPSEWDMRKLGSTLEVEPAVNAVTGTVNIQFVSEIVRHVKNQIWFEWHDPHGTSHVETPEFHILSCHQSVIVIPGVPLLAATLTPQGQDGTADPTRKVMVFVKCDLTHPGN